MTLVRMKKNLTTSMESSTVTKKSINYTSRNGLKVKRPSTMPSSIFQMDLLLQPTHNRRRYMRRGSKTPMMMLISQVEINDIDDHHRNDGDVDGDEKCPEAKKLQRLGHDDGSFQHHSLVNTMFDDRQTLIMNSLQTHFDTMKIRYVPASHTNARVHDPNQCVYRRTL